MGKSLALDVNNIYICIFNISMKPIEKALNKLEGYLLSIERDVMKGHYELKVGIPKKWVYESTDKVECEVIHSTKEGDVVKVFALEDDIIIDDLILFVNIIIDTNKQIAEMQEKHKLEKEKTIEKMEAEELAFSKEIEDMAKNSFKNMQEKQNNIHSKSKKKVVDTDDLKQEIEEKLSN